MHTITTTARIEEQSQYDQERQSYWTSIREASPDGFNAGSSYRTESKFSLGTPGTEITIKLQMRNHTKTERWKDKNTQQPRSIIKNVTYFEVLEIIQKPNAKAS